MSDVSKKLAGFVQHRIQPAIDEFAHSLCDDELCELLKQYPTMMIDLRKDLTKHLQRRKLSNADWNGSSPLDQLLEQEND